MTVFLGIFVSSFLLALSGALMPGPLLTMAIGESPRKGYLAGPLLILGHGILEAALLVCLMLGLAPILKQDSIFGVIALSGSIILLWMAFGMLRSIPSLSLDFNSGQTTSGHLILSGILMSLANPYWLIWWATIGLGYIIHCQQFGLLGVIVFFIGHILADLVWYSLVSFSVVKGRSFLNVSFYRGLIGFCACFLVIFAGYFGYSGFEKVF
ncbi:LysE family translocator [bacterium]|nr:LysE family translocator [bacterium]